MSGTIGRCFAKQREDSLALAVDKISRDEKLAVADVLHPLEWRDHLVRDLDEPDRLTIASGWFESQKSRHARSVRYIPGLSRKPPSKIWGAAFVR